MMSATGMRASTLASPETRPGANPKATLRQLEVQPIPHRVVRALLEREHYLRSLPGGTMLCFGVFLGDRLMGALTIGVGPKLGHRLVEGASSRD